MTAVAQGKIYRGVVRDGDALVALYAAPFDENFMSGAIAVGFSMEDTAWMETVKSLVNCEITVFKDNIRFAAMIHPQVEKVYHSSLPDHPDYALYDTILQ